MSHNKFARMMHSRSQARAIPANCILFILQNWLFLVTTNKQINFRIWAYDQPKRNLWTYIRSNRTWHGKLVSNGSAAHCSIDEIAEIDHVFGAYHESLWLSRLCRHSRYRENLYLTRTIPTFLNVIAFTVWFGFKHLVGVHCKYCRSSK